MVEVVSLFEKYNFILSTIYNVCVKLIIYDNKTGLLNYPKDQYMYLYYIQIIRNNAVI